MRSRSPQALAALLPALIALVIAVAGCGGGGTTVGAGGARAKQGTGAGGGKIIAFDPRNGPLGCILGKGLQAQKDPRQPDRIDILPPTTGASIAFAANAAEAQDRQLADQASGAEVIGPALLTTGDLSDADLDKIERCLQAQGTKY